MNIFVKYRFSFHLFFCLFICCAHPSIEALNMKRATQHYERGMQFYKQGLYSDAIDELRAAVAFAPWDGLIHCALGLSFLQTHYYDGAVEHFVQAVKLRPDLEEAQYNLANLYNKIYDDPVRAIIVLNNALQSYKFPRLSLYLGDIYFDQKRYKESSQQYQNVLLIDSTLTTAQEKLGLALYYQGDFNQSKEIMKKVLMKDSLDVSVHFSLGVIYQQEGKTDSAIIQYQKVLSIESGHTDALYNLGTVYYELGELDEALRIFQLLVVLASDRFDAYLSLALVLDKRHDQYKAIKMYNRALALNPNSLTARLNLGLLYRSGEQYSNALNELQKAKELTNDPRLKMQINDAITHLKELLAK